MEQSVTTRPAAQNIATLPGIAHLHRTALRYPSVVLLVAVSALSAIGWWRLLLPDFPFTYDGDLHIARVLHMEHELKSGQFPVRWGSEQAWGYGYPTFNFYYPLPYYLAALLHMLGLSAAFALKALAIAGLILGAVGMALWARAVWGLLGGLIAGTLYALSPSILQATYLVMTIGEIIVFGLLPAICWALLQACRSERWRRPLLVLAAVGMAACVLSHNFLGPVGLVLIGFYALSFSVMSRSLRPLLFTSGSAGAALALSAFFWLPAYVELQDTPVKPENLRFTPLSSLFNFALGPRIGYTGETGHYAHAWDTIGAANIAAGILALVAAVAFYRYLDRERRGHLLFALAAFLGLVALMAVPYQRHIWLALPLLQHAQYSARLLPLISLAAAFAGGSVSVWTWSRPLLTAALLIVAAVYGFAFARPAFTQRGEDLYFLTYTPVMRGTADWDRTVLPKQARLDVQAPLHEPSPHLSDPAGRLLHYQKRSTYIQALVDLPTPAMLTLPVFFFPGWQAWVDGQPVLVTVAAENGTVQVPLPAGQHHVTVRFTDTPVRRLGNALTAITAAALLSTGAVGLYRAGRAKAAASGASKPK